MNCPVCFEPLESAFVAECGHPLCRICKDRIDATCPICRQPDLNFHPLYLPDREERKEEEGDPGLTPSEKLEKVKDERDRAVATMTESMEVAKMIHSMLATVRAERDAALVAVKAERNLRELNADNLSLQSMPPHFPHGADQRHYFSICGCGKLKAVNSFASALEGKMQYFSVCRSCKERKESRRNCGSSDDGSSGSSSKCPCGRPKRSFHRLCKSCHQGY